MRCHFDLNFYNFGRDDVKDPFKKNVENQRNELFNYFLHTSRKNLIYK